MTGSLGGGTGSGLTSNVLQYMRENSPVTLIEAFYLFPSIDTFAHPL